MNAACRVRDRQLAARSARMAGVLRTRGVGAGDCVAVALPAVGERPVVVYGVLRLGAVVAALEPVADPDALRAGMALAGATLLVAWHTLAEAAEAVGARALFVAPGEFDRLLDGATPDRSALDREDADEALRTVGADGIRIVTHGELELA